MLIKKNTLAEKFVIELAAIFNDQNWEIEESTNDEYSIFDIFCKRLEDLETDADRELMIELTRKYLVVGAGEYYKYMFDVFKKFINCNRDVMMDIDTIHIFPVQDKDYPEKTKSGNMMCYLFQGLLMRRFDVFRNKRVRIIETFDGLVKHKDDIKCLLVVDDFVGSGDTLLGCVNSIEEKGIEKEKIKVLTLVLQECGKKVADEYGVEIYTSVLRNKGITDNYSEQEAQEKKEQMKRISKRFKVKDKNLYLGYKESEGLVSMIKTPNNTFPFYWYEGKREGKLSLAPFPRRNNVGVDV
ncbi:MULTISPECIES: phosphoribosyltransferase [unclassified Blautia]|uniref:phosphoribosyltransferase n=1 Tax=unclassified Blautia TaxID=2648079 RepID=UPI0009308ECC|nr:phosphoribosyltransferase [Blautia sp. Marseille-P3201T]